MELRWQRPQLEIPLPPAIEKKVAVANPLPRGGRTHTRTSDNMRFGTFMLHIMPRIHTSLNPNSGHVIRCEPAFELGRACPHSPHVTFACEKDIPFPMIAQLSSPTPGLKYRGAAHLKVFSVLVLNLNAFPALCCTGPYACTIGHNSNNEPPGVYAIHS